MDENYVDFFEKAPPCRKRSPWEALDDFKDRVLLLHTVAPMIALSQAAFILGAEIDEVRPFWNRGD